MIMFASQYVVEIGANLAGMSITMTAVFHLAVWFMSLCMTAAFIEKKLWFATAGMMIAFLFACAYPDRVWLAMSAGNVVLLANFLLAWRDPVADREYTNQRIRAEIEALQRRFK
jgi:hypothetical protein